MPRLFGSSSVSKSVQYWLVSHKTARGLVGGIETDMIVKSSGQYRAISTVKLMVLIITIPLTTPVLQAYLTYTLVPITLSATL
jgi:hypothetical protein